MKKFAKYESFDPENKGHLDALSRHEFYCTPGTIRVVIDESHQPERLSETAQCPNCTLEDTCDVCWSKYLETLGCDSLNTANK